MLQASKTSCSPKICTAIIHNFSPHVTQVQQKNSPSSCLWRWITVSFFIRFPPFPPFILDPKIIYSSPSFVARIPIALTFSRWCVEICNSIWTIFTPFKMFQFWRAMSAISQELIFQIPSYKGKDLGGIILTKLEAKITCYANWSHFCCTQQILFLPPSVCLQNISTLLLILHVSTLFSVLYFTKSTQS